MPSGAPGNLCERPTPGYARIGRRNGDGSGMEGLANGVRNTVGFDWHPRTRELWFSKHGRDGMGDDLPDDTLNRLAKTGSPYGFPTCHQGSPPAPDIHKAAPCTGVSQPGALTGPPAAIRPRDLSI